MSIICPSNNQIFTVCNSETENIVPSTVEIPQAKSLRNENVHLRKATSRKSKWIVMV